MAIELKLTRSDSKTHWGFRLTGGTDHNSPVTVIKVSEGGKAARAGLQVGDLVVRVNDTPLSGLSYTQFHDAIAAAGNNLTLVIRRDFSDLYPKTSLEQQVKNQIVSILESARETLESERFDFAPKHTILDHYLNEREVEDSYSSKLEVRENHLNGSGIPDEYSDASEMTVHGRQEQDLILQKSEISSFSESSQYSQQEIQPPYGLQGRKWSTFLQKPDKPKPAPKSREPEKPKGETYRVVIQKQKKKPLPLYSEPDDNLDTKEETFNKDEEESNRDNGIEKDSIDDDEDREIKSESDVQERYGEKGEEEREEMSREENNNVVEENDNIPQSEAEEPVSEKPLTLEEQLAQVQKQLEALTQLPSSIQDTLSEVTKKLAHIVGKTPDQERSEDNEKHVRFMDNSGDELSDIERDAELHSDEEQLEEDSLEASARNMKEQLDIDQMPNIDEIDATDDEVNSLLDEGIDVQKIEEDVPDPAEEEAKRLEQERLEKQAKEEQARPLKPVQRPIILPGGRKWVEPDDACPKIKNPRMTDEKIANTLEQFSEVITGKLKGINFMKYQPPPKNLDYLQRSEVYRLVHDMEPPVRGISTRAGKILAEEDYYQRIRQE